jgi:DNA-binding PadR family transcriptional regulator
MFHREKGHGRFGHPHARFERGEERRHAGHARRSEEEQCRSERGGREHRFANRHGGRGGPGGPFGRGPFGGDPFGGDDGRRGGPRQRQRRGDIKYILLEVLAEQPRHGYDLIKVLEERYGGFYRPSPGSVYPTLQLLEEEGSLSSETVDGKRVYTITEAGKALLEARKQEEEQHGRGRPFFGRGEPNPDLHKLRESMAALNAGLMQVAQHGTPEQLKAAIEQLEATRRAIYTILAQQNEA